MHVFEVFVDIVDSTCKDDLACLVFASLIYAIIMKVLCNFKVWNSKLFLNIINFHYENLWMIK